MKPYALGYRRKERAQFHFNQDMDFENEMQESLKEVIFQNIKALEHNRVNTLQLVYVARLCVPKEDSDDNLYN